MKSYSEMLVWLYEEGYAIFEVSKTSIIRLAKYSGFEYIEKSNSFKQL